MKSASQILLACVLAVAIVCPVRADGASIHSASAAELQHRLHGHWTRQTRGTDGRGVCLIDIVVNFRADGRFIYTRTFHPLVHQKPAWDFLLNSGTWKLAGGILVQHWDGNGEHPGGYTTRRALLNLSAKRFRCAEGVDGTVSYHRTSKQVYSDAPPRTALQQTEAGGDLFPQSTPCTPSPRH